MHFWVRVDEGFKHLTQPYVWKTREGLTGEGHVLIITGYNDEMKGFRIMNSWSSAWGDKGFA